jgi:glucose/arabinose dehydrogenase
MPPPPRPDLGAVSVGLQEIASGFASPVAIAFHPGSGTPYVAEQDGRVRVVEGGRPGRVVLDLAGEVSGANEQGLLGLTLSTDGTHLYIAYTDEAGDTRVQEFALRDGVVDVASRRELLRVDQPFRNHNGGEVVFGPDGMLYIGLGDGGGAGDPYGNAQRLDNLLGKILRIDPRARGGEAYTVPADNPFAGRDGARGEIWMFGLRNPWRFSFDRKTRDVWIGDVGQGAYEEIDHAPARAAAGANWGWNAREGLHAFTGAAPPGARDPIAELTHDEGNCAVTGGYVYRGEVIEHLAGVYVFADYCVGELIGLVFENGVVTAQRTLGPRLDSVTSFGEDGAGELYVLSRGGGVYKIVPG